MVTMCREMQPHKGAALEQMTELPKPNAVEAKNDLDETGHVLIRNFFDSSLVAKARQRFLDILAARKCIDCADSQNYIVKRPHYFDQEAEFLSIMQETICCEELFDIVFDDSVRKFFEEFFGEKIFLHPLIYPRIVFPTPDDLLWTITASHQDYAYVQGDTRFVTMWLPLDDCPIEAGPLKVMTGSHRGPLLKSRLAAHGGYELDTPSAAVWASAPMNLGDALIFNNHTIHSALQNISTRVRMSLDFRIQPVSGSISRRQIPTDNYLFGVKLNRLYSQLKNRQRKYYWLRENLAISPAMPDVAFFSGWNLSEAIERVGGGDLRELPLIYRASLFGGTEEIKSLAKGFLAKNGIRGVSDVRVPSGSADAR